MNSDIDDNVMLQNVDDAIRHYGHVFPLLKNLKITPQEPEWHGEGNVAIHTDMVIERVNEESKGLGERDRMVLSHAAAFHDIAKPLVTREVEIDGKLRIVSPRHARVGRSYLAARGFDLFEDTVAFDDVIALVGHHHDVRKLVADDLPQSSYARLARMCDLKLLYHLCRADMLGRICKDDEVQLEQVELFKMQAKEYGYWEHADPYEDWYSIIQNRFADRKEAFHKHAFAMAKRDFEVERIRSVEEAVARSWKLAEKTYTLTILCGPSGSGKSNWIERNGEEVIVVSLDKLRKLITGKRESQTMNGQVMQAAKDELKKALRAKKDVFFDATNLRVDGRGWVVQLANDYGAYSRIVCFKNSMDELVRRNRKREHAIQESVLMRQIEQFEWPFADEACEVVYV